ncbi:hypothetical protein H6F61_11575 [Cyanobacteria bacterium FACHB-472]|nr:hypothetical protein [Cyanobacteria bacterium FACHB-472]
MLQEYEIADLWLNDLKNKEVADVIKRFIADLYFSWNLENLSDCIEIREDNSINLILGIFNLSNVEPFEELETERGEIIFLHSPEIEVYISNVLERDLEQRFQQAGLDYIVVSNASVEEEWGESVCWGLSLSIYSRQGYEEEEIERARKAEQKALA